MMDRPSSYVVQDGPAILRGIDARNACITDGVIAYRESCELLGYNAGPRANINEDPETAFGR